MPPMVRHDGATAAQWRLVWLNMVALLDADKEQLTLICTHLAVAPWWRRHHLGRMGVGLAPGLIVGDP